MASQVFNVGKHLILNRALFGSALSMDLHIALLMTNTTADSENDSINVVSDFTLLDEFDGANYVRKALTGETVTRDDANDRANLDADNVTWAALGAGTRSVAGILLYTLATDDADSPPIAWLEFTTPKTPDGSDFTLNIADLLRAT